MKLKLSFVNCLYLLFFIMISDCSAAWFTGYFLFSENGGRRGEEPFTYFCQRVIFHFRRQSATTLPKKIKPGYWDQCLIKKIRPYYFENYKAKFWKDEVHVSDRCTSCREQMHFMLRTDEGFLFVEAKAEFF